jgi:hypothetical protein
MLGDRGRGRSSTPIHNPTPTSSVAAAAITRGAGGPGGPVPVHGRLLRSCCCCTIRVPPTCARPAGRYATRCCAVPPRCCGSPLIVVVAVATTMVVLVVLCICTAATAVVACPCCMPRPALSRCRGGCSVGTGHVPAAGCWPPHAAYELCLALCQQEVGGGHVVDLSMEQVLWAGSNNHQPSASANTWQHVKCDWKSS